jgi:hypothetical protein
MYMSEVENFYVKIINSLIDSDWHEAIHNTPFSSEDLKIFVNDIRSLVSELRDFSDEDVETLTLNAVKYFSERWCSLEKSFEPQLPLGIYNGIRLYKCLHPDLEVFYMIIARDFFPISISYGYYSRSSGEEHFAFYLTKSFEKALKEYEEIEEMIKDEVKILRDSLTRR